MMKKVLLVACIFTFFTLTACNSLLGNVNHSLPVEEKEQSQTD
ncbi:hypothetical protein [Thermoactinomyces mirandus]|nr:hypothetical protein [Thermoactinomyces mirandus]